MYMYALLQTRPEGTQALHDVLGWLSTGLKYQRGGVTDELPVELPVGSEGVAHAVSHRERPL